MNDSKFNIAVLIDGDNAQASLLKYMLEEISKYGKATIRRIYGDWTIPQMNSWKESLNQYSINPIQKFSYTTGKNSTDSSLIIDAMDILHGQSVDGFFSSVGLILDIIGVLLLFKYGLPSKVSSAPIRVLEESTMEEQQRIIKNRKIRFRANFGLSLIIFGFILQFVGTNIAYLTSFIKRLFS
jgi:hypothetical protein